jgi:hypothetical protein
MTSNYFQYEDKFYEQKKGTPMGSPASPDFADLVMDVLLDTVTSRIDFPVAWVKKYVDDLILTAPSDKCSEILLIFNSYNSNIQTT